MGGSVRGLAVFSALLLLLAVLPLASAGTDLDLGVVQVVVVDQHGAACGLAACPVTVQGDHPGSTYVDASQRVESIRVVFDFSSLRDDVELLSLLPDQSVVIDGASLFLPVPAFRIVDGGLDPDPTPAWSPVLFHVNESGAGIRHSLPFGDGGMWMPFANDSEIGVQYDGISLYHALLVTNTTDNYFAQNYESPCQFYDVCLAGAIAPVTDAYFASTPNGRAGVEFVEARVVTDPSLLPEDAGVVVRASAAAPIVRAPQATPARLVPEPGATVRLDALPDDASPDGDDSRRVRVSGGSSAASEAGVAQLASPSTVPLWRVVATGVFVAAALAAAAFALYSRFNTRDEALRSETRARVLEAIKAEPGLSAREIGERTGLSRNGATHHVKILQRMGLVRVERRHRRAFVFPLGVERQVESTVVARLIENDPLVDLLLREPGLTRAQIHERLKHMPHRTRNHKLRRLLEMGAIVCRRDAFFVRDG